MNELIDKFIFTKAITESLVSPLSLEDYACQPIEFVSPPKWHLAHTAWYFENFILNQFKSYRQYNEKFNYLFNSYYNSFGSRIAQNNRGSFSRPSVEEIIEYREYVYSNIVNFSNEIKLQPNLFQLLELGINHEQQHQELLITDIKYILGTNPLFPVYLAIPENKSDIKPSNLKYLPIEEGIYEIGYSGDEFTFDNEKERHKVYMEKFEIADRIISNAEYLEFMNDGGYTNPLLWLSDGWNFINSNSISSPLYWNFIDGIWMEYTLNGLKCLNQNEPLRHISYYEAEAFAYWAGKRLPTETEWETACNIFNPNIESKGLLENSVYEPHFNGESQPFIGNCWEWTNSSYLPYPRYKRAKGALGEYNGKFMINQMVLRGGSVATPYSHIRATYRNFFTPDRRWQFSGIRLVK